MAQLQSAFFFEDLDLADFHTLVLNTEGMLGTGIVTSDDMFQYDPGTAFDHLAAGETAIETFSYTVADAFGESSTSTVTITLTGRNDGPVAVALAPQTDEQTAINIAPSFTDPDTNDSHSLQVDTTGTLGTVTIKEDGTFSYDPNGKFDALNHGELATDTFTYTVTDNHGSSSTETVTVTIQGESESAASPAKIVASDATTGDMFGRDAQINDSGVVVVGSPSDDGKRGSIYVYTPTSDGDYTENKLIAADRAASDWFGVRTAVNSTGTIAVAASGDTVNGVSSGSIYVFIPDETGSYTSTKLTPSDGRTGDAIGVRGLSMTEAGVIAVSTNSDKIYVYTPNGEGDYIETKLVSSFRGGHLGFGGFMDMNENGTIITSAQYIKDGPNNLARVFTPNAEGQYAEMRLRLPEAGSSIACNGEALNDGTIVVGTNQSVYVYKPDDVGNYSVTKLSGIASANYDLDVNSGGVIVASSNDVASIFVPDDNNGYKQIVLRAFDGINGDPFDAFGSSVSINEDGVVVVSARYDDDKGKDSGSIYIFTPDADGNYVGPDGTVYEPSETPPVIETFDSAPLEVIGSDSAESLLGGNADDVIVGNGGNDIIDAGLGSDTLTGGEGNDTFLFASDEAGHDVITDFVAGAGSEDLIEIDSSMFTDFTALIAAAEDQGANTVITIDGDSSITLKDVNIADLHQDDFSFL
ncbi:MULTISPECIES: VCBS domain-containing protein [Pseudovibrio]|uniref:VCBS domain-containing protein n=1 Tax=Stappiaceae TaxID=2821832 RepID=UPI0023667C0D|nr:MULTISPECIES: VCBS domain-containing protein [Pseudovibrio]MDD7908465.1 VCBS domain-containing protein [Pseudovibrio exalbescens]MDX5592665.1 VCBS domain-containing protein [Pseudovibrio sp. SPO723]